MHPNHSYNLLYHEGTRRQAYQFLLALIAAVSLAAPFLIADAPAVKVTAGLAALAVAVLSLMRLDLALGLLFLASPLVIVGERTFGDYKLAFAAAVFLLWAAKKIHDGRALALVREHPLARCIACFIALSFLSVLFAQDAKVSLKYFFKYLGNLAFFFVFFDVLRSEKDVRKLALFLLAGAVLEAFYGLAEFAWHAPGSFPLLYRSKGTFYHPNIYGRFLSLLFVFTLALFLGERRKRWRIFYALVGLVFIAGLAASFSRSSVLSLLSGCAFLVPMFYRWRIRKALNALIAALFVALSLVVAGTVIGDSGPDRTEAVHDFEEQLKILPEGSSMDAFLSQRMFRSLAREKMWDGCFRMLKERPWTGFGVGMIAVASGPFLDMTYWDVIFLLDQFEKEGELFTHVIPNAHNLFLHVGVEMGIGGILIIVWMYALIFSFLKRHEPALGEGPVEQAAVGRSDIQPRAVGEGPARSLPLGGAACVITDLLMGTMEPANLFGPGSLGFLFVFFSSLIFIAPRLQCRGGARRQ
jgi:O-antigen ligase